MLHNLITVIILFLCIRTIVNAANTLKLLSFWKNLYCEVKSVIKPVQKKKHIPIVNCFFNSKNFLFHKIVLIGVMVIDISLLLLTSFLFSIGCENIPTLNIIFIIGTALTETYVIMVKGIIEIDINRTQHNYHKVSKFLVTKTQYKV